MNSWFFKNLDVSIQTIFICKESANKEMLLFSHPVISNCLQLHGLHHARPPWPSPSPNKWWGLISFKITPWWLTGKEAACNVVDLGSISGLGRSPGEGNGYQLQYSGLENPMDCIVHWVTKSQTRLSDFHFTSFKIDCFDLLVVQGSLRSLLQNHSLKASILWLSAFFQFSSVQSLSRIQLFATPWITASQASLSITNSQSLLKLMSIESVMPSSHLILCRPLLLLPPIPPSIRVFSNESTPHEVAKVLEFQLQHQSF